MRRGEERRGEERREESHRKERSREGSREKDERGQGEGEEERNAGRPYYVIYMLGRSWGRDRNGAGTWPRTGPGTGPEEGPEQDRKGWEARSPERTGIIFRAGPGDRKGTGTRTGNRARGLRLLLKPRQLALNRKTVRKCTFFPKTLG